MRIALLALPLLLACNAGSTDSDDDTGDTEEPAPEFDPDDPGIHLSLTLGAVHMMGQPIELAAGVVFPTAREDFDVEDADEIPLDTCVVTDNTQVAECAGPDDCAPEQQCVPEYDNDGAPVAGSEHCETPRDPLDGGPITLSSGSSTLALAYNPGQSGGYTTAGGDGSLPEGTLEFGTTYDVSGEGSADLGLGPITGSIPLPEQLVLTSPAMTDVGWGMQGLVIDPTADLSLTWTGTASGPLTLTLSGGSMTGDSGGITCRVQDDGEFTISADLVSGVPLGDMAMLNTLTLDRASEGEATADGLTIDRLDTKQTLLIFVGVDG